MSWQPSTWDFLTVSGRPLTAVRRWAEDHGYIGTEGGWIRRYRSYDAGERGQLKRVVPGPTGLVCQGWAAFVARFERQLREDPAVVAAARANRRRDLRQRERRYVQLVEGNPGADFFASELALIRRQLTEVEHPSPVGE